MVLSQQLRLLTLTFVRNTMMSVQGNTVNHSKWGSYGSYGVKRGRVSFVFLLLENEVVGGSRPLISVCENKMSWHSHSSWNPGLQDATWTSG